MKYVYSIFLILVLTVFVSNNCSAQYKLDAKEGKEFTRLNNKLKGHYQIQVINSRKEPIIDYEMLKTIDKKLERRDDKSFYYKPNIRIVLSSNKIPEYVEEKKVVFSKE